MLPSTSSRVCHSFRPISIFPFCPGLRGQRIISGDTERVSLDSTKLQSTCMKSLLVEILHVHHRRQASADVPKRFSALRSSPQNYPTLEMSTHTSSFLQRRIITTLAPTGRPRLEELLALLEHGDVDLSPLLTHRMKLSDTPAAYDLFRSRADGVLKIALTP